MSTVSEVGHCHTCGVEFTSRKSAREHSRRTGHRVSVEVTKAYFYGDKR